MKKFNQFAIFVMACLFVGCEPNNFATLDKVVTGATSDITAESVVLHGKVNVDISLYENVEFGIIISENEEELKNHDGVVFQAEILTSNDFKLKLEGLYPATKYYYSAWLFLNGTQYEYGAIKGFKTNTDDSSLPNFRAKAFSVSEHEQVTFSPGNLQYTQSIKSWSFAENQWDMIGTDNVTGDSVESDEHYGDEKVGDALNDKIDLFGWSTSANNFGVSTSTDNDDYSGSFVDWSTNKIGDDAPCTWRTLTSYEWYYLIFERPNASSLYGAAQVNGVNGLILLPDDWTCPFGIPFKSGCRDIIGGVKYYSIYQIFTANQWSKMERQGAVFLPAAGCRLWGIEVRYVQGRGEYWTSTRTCSSGAYSFMINSDDHIGVDVHYDEINRREGLSVRLVKDL